MKIQNTQFEKLSKKLLFLTLVLVAVGLFFSCKNQLLPTPSLPSDNSNNQISSSSQWGAPQNLKATQGLKQQIILSWDSVKGAIRYHIYKADSPYDEFVQIGETVDATVSYTMKVESGTDSYYKITAVNQQENESPFSSIQRGTSLAKPIISEISTPQENSDSSINVYWYMGNVDAYRQHVRYTVICADSKGTEITRISVDGSNTTTTSASFQNLLPNTDYIYTVEAYLVSSQADIEQSVPMDATTARRLRPNPPENPNAQKGKSKSQLNVSFVLPDFVDVAVSSGVYEQNPLYFKIYRREKALEGQKQKEFIPICTYFGYKPDEESSGKKNFGYTEYIPGEIVTYTDNVDLKRGVVYEYKIQSFADESNREITSDLSWATCQGYLVSPIEFNTSNYSATANETEEAYVSAQVGFTLDWNSLGNPEEYAFILEETKHKLEIDNGGQVDEQGTPGEPMTFATIEEINSYVREFDLSTPEQERGYYKYKIHLVPAGSTDSSAALDSVTAIGQVLVTESMELPKVEWFSATSGYNDRIVLEWNYDASYKYSISYIQDGKSHSIPEEQILPALQGKKTGDTVTFEHTTESGITREYIIYTTTVITRGTDEFPVRGSTLDVPKVQVSSYEYDSINVQWQKIEGAAGYAVAAAYQNAAIEQTNPIESAKEIPAEGPFTYSFEKPNGYDNAAVSGLPVAVTVQAKSNVERNVVSWNTTEEKYELSTESVKDEQGNQITETSSSSISSHTIGPALLNAKAIQAVATDSINLAWNEVEGAAAYAIIRNRYHIAPGGSDDYQSTEKYIVKNSNGGLVVEQLGGMDDISGCVTVVQDNGKIKLTDKYAAQTDSNTSWQISQSQIPWGCPYDYIVLPLVSADDEVEYDYSVDAKSITVDSVELASMPSTRGSALGYGWNVAASKGWQNAELQGEASFADNSSIYVSWDNPSISSAQTVTYSVHRRQQGGTNWQTLTSGTTNKYYEDTTAQPGTVYEYAIGLQNTSDPTGNADYIDFSAKNMDGVFANEAAAAGFILPMPEITSASRQALPNNAEQIIWPAAKVGGTNNRMIDGYIIEVLNNNISAGWNKIAEIKHSDDGAKPTYTQLVDNSSGLLKVLRDYKHYFRIRSFREQNGKRTYSPAPNYTWSDGAENTYVKWGARQITIDEFALVAATSIGDSLYNDTYSSVKEGNIGYDRTYTFKTPGPSFQNISGNLYGYATATGSKPKKYGAVCAGIWGAASGPKTKTSTLTFTENTGVGMYSGTVVIENLDSSSGTFRVTYNEQTKECYTQDIGKLFKY